TSQKGRSQYFNKRECLKKLRALVEKLNYRPPKRVPTRVPKSAKQETLAKKAKHSAKKRMRGKPTE
ncbi:MAG: peptide chain release factor-like protein, partial [Parachlamydia sp.]|nr:peptide chain release factor-like protein [Parachlamydia sp.]